MEKGQELQLKQNIFSYMKLIGLGILCDYDTLYKWEKPFVRFHVIRTVTQMMLMLMREGYGNVHFPNHNILNFPIVTVA